MNRLLYTSRPHKYGGYIRVFDKLQYAVVGETWCEIRASLPARSTDRGKRGAIKAQGPGFSKQIAVARINS